MPEAFDRCVREGGRVRRKTLKNGGYINICFPKGGGPGIAGEPHEKDPKKGEKGVGKNSEKQGH